LHARLGVLGILVAFLPWPSLEAALLEVALGQVIDARVIIERWRQAYNRLRPDSAPSATGRRPQRRSCRPRRRWGPRRTPWLSHVSAMGWY
jgi:hypothetical protein